MEKTSKCDYAEDMERLQHLWKETQKTSAHHPTKDYDFLLSQNNQLKSQIEALNKANMELKQKLQEQHRNLNQHQDYQKSQSKMVSFQNHQYDDLSSKYEDLSSKQKEFCDKAKTQNNYYLDQLSNKDAEILSLKAQLSEQTSKITHLSLTNDNNWSLNFQASQQIKQKDEELAFLKSEVVRLKKETENLMFARKDEGTVMLQLEHLKSDKERLMELLRGTKEWKEFGCFADDHLNSISFLKRMGEGKGEEEAGKRSCLREERKKVKEEEMWVPSEAFQFAREFRGKYGGELTDELIEYLLFELNRIWAKREEQRLARIKGNCAKEVSSLRRKLKVNPSYSEVIDKQTISRLKGQLQRSYAENKENYNRRENKYPPDVEYVREVMKISAQAARNKKRIVEENAILKNALNKSQNK